MAGLATDQADWITRIAPYRALFLRRGWFVVLSMLIATISTAYIPDITLPPTYQATLHIQAPLATGFNSENGQNSAAIFYTHLFINPTTLTLVLPQHKGWQLSDLRSSVTATPLTDANVVELSAVDLSPQLAIELVTEVFNTVIKEISQHRSDLMQQLTNNLTTELIQTRNDAQSSYATLQILQAERLTYTSVYIQLTRLYGEQQARAAAISRQLLTLQQQGLQSTDILRLASSTPTLTTIPGNSPTQNKRLMLAPLIGLIMGLGGIVLADTFSTRIPLHGKKRGLVLPRVSAVIPVLPGLRKNPLQTLRQTSPCLALFRHLRYQASEHERALHVVTVTSAGRREGKSMVACGLALAASQNGQRTLLIDAHPQRPVLHKWHGLQIAPGMLETLRSFALGIPVPALILFPPLDALCVLPSGKDESQLQRMSELCDLVSLQQMIAFLRNEADLLIFDAPPLLNDPNTANLVQLSDMTLLVVDAQKSHSTAVIEADRLLSTMEATSVTVVNQASAGYVA